MLAYLQVLRKFWCEKTVVDELLRTGMVGMLAQVLTRYHEKEITRIRSHVYWEENKLTEKIISHHIFSFSHIFTTQVMTDLVVKGTLAVNEKPFDQKQVPKFLKDVLKGKFWDLRRLILRYSTNFMTSLVK